jgi:hypothetical protein
MTTYMIDLNKTYASETEIVDIATELLLDGRSMSECRGYLMSEYAVIADELGGLLAKAQRDVRACEVEFNTRLRF